MGRIVLFIILGVAALLVVSSVKMVGTDEVVLTGSGTEVRELPSGINFLRPFAGVRRFKLSQSHDLSGDRGLEVGASGLKRVAVDCRLELQLEPEKIRALDRDFDGEVVEKLLRPVLERELRDLLSNHPEPGALADAGPAVAQAVNRTVQTLGVTLTGLSLSQAREQPALVHHLKKGEGVKVFILGLDGYDWLIRDQVVQTRTLPNTDRILRGGTWGNLRSMEPLVSPLIWTTMVTGVTPDVHGITDFLVRDEVTGEDIPVTSSMRRVPALWNIASLFDLTSGFIGWFASFPAEEVKGFVVSDRFAYHMFDPSWKKGNKQPLTAGVTYPQDLVRDIDHLRVRPEDVRDEMSRYISGAVREFKATEDGLLYWNSRRPDDPEGNLRLVISAYRTYEQVMRQLYASYHPDLFGVYFEFTDSVGHLFMKFMRPAMAGVSQEEEERYGDCIAGAYAEADRIAGEVLELLDDSTVLLVVSDHGFKSGDMRPLSDSRIGYGQAIAWHRINGAIAMYGSIVKQGHHLEGASVMDIAPTILYLLGLPVDRKMGGRVLLDAFEDSWVKAHPVSYTSQYDSLIVSSRTAVAPSEADKALKEKLVSLGYVAGGNTALVNLANYYHQNGRYAEALGVWKQLADLEPDNLGARIGMSNAYYQLGQTDIAIKGLNEVLQRDPQNMKSLHSLVTIYIETGRSEEALATAERAVRTNPNDGQSYYDRGLALDTMGRHEEAAAAYRAAIRLAPDLAEAYANLAQIYVDAGRPTEALELAEKAVALGAGKPEMNYVLGVALSANGRQEDALAQFRAAMRLDSSFVPAYVGACGVFLSRGEADSVIVVAAQALKEPSAYAVYLHNLKGSAHAIRGELKPAAEEFRAALEASPGYITARVNLAKVYMQEGKRAEATEQLRTVLAAYPNHQEAKALLESLR